MTKTRATKPRVSHMHFRSSIKRTLRSVHEPRRAGPSLGIVLKIEPLTGSKLNGRQRKIAQIKFPDGSETTAYIPDGLKGVTEGAPVLIRASRTNSLAEVGQRVVKPLNGRYKSGKSGSRDPGFTWNWASQTT